jgi:hypothetical protein
MRLPRYDGDSYFLADFLNLAQRRLCAAAILALLAADIFRRLRLGCPSLYTPANAVSAAFKPDRLPLYAVAFLFQLRTDGPGATVIRRLSASQKYQSANESQFLLLFLPRTR